MSTNTLTTKPAEKNIVNREITRNPDQYAVPLVDIFETPEGLSVVADLPGVPRENLNVKVENGILTIEGRMAPPEFKDAWMKEFESVNFFRQFELTDAVAQENIQAELKNGVLKVFLPREEATKPRQIPIKVS